MAVGACASPSRDEAPAIAERSSGCIETSLPWGSGDGEVGLRPAAAERLAWGPQAVAMTPAGEALVIDGINGRVLAVGRAGVRDTGVAIAHDAEDVAVGADGSFAVYSALQSKAWMFEPDGTPAGELAIDRSLHDVVGLTVESSRRIAIRTAYQETYPVGSVHAPVAVATSRTGKREGGLLLADGRGITATATAGAGVVHLVTNAGGRRSVELAAFPLPGSIDAVTPVGVTGTIACFRTEQVDQPGDQLRVARRAVCVDVADGRVVLDRALPGRGSYLPRHDVAFAYGWLTSLTATDDGLAVSSCKVSR